MIAAANWARLNKKPYLGICLGFQCAVIEFARNVLNLKDASSSEFDKNATHQVVRIFFNVYNQRLWYPILYIVLFFYFQKIIEMPEHNPGQMGGTMRLGKRRTIFKTESILSNDLFFYNILIFLIYVFKII